MQPFGSGFNAGSTAPQCTERSFDFYLGEEAVTTSLSSASGYWNSASGHSEPIIAPPADAVARRSFDEMLRASDCGSWKILTLI